MDKCPQIVPIEHNLITEHNLIKCCEVPTA